MSPSEAPVPGNRLIVEGEAAGEVLACAEGLSFWGGVDPETGKIIDVHHKNYGASVSGKILLMPTSRGSCSGSGVLLDLSLNGLAPSALVFCEPEEILTLGALVSDKVFGLPVPTISLGGKSYKQLAASSHATLSGHRISAVGLEIDLSPLSEHGLELSDHDRHLLGGDGGPAAKLAMEIICLMAVACGAEHLTGVTRGHIDGCILAHSANLIFAERMANLDARVTVPTTINAISVDRENWHRQGVPETFGARASRLADAYVRMGAQPTFTCAPYLLDNAPKQNERLGWSESNAVIFANSILGARTLKHPDYLDLFIAMTGRAPASGVYIDAGRQPHVIINVDLPEAPVDDLFWPLLGWLVGNLSPDQVPLLAGLEGLRPSQDDLKALCAAFGTTSGAPMLHIYGHTPEAHQFEVSAYRQITIGPAEFAEAWRKLNRGSRDIDLVAIGSPHASLSEVRALAEYLGNRRRNPTTEVIVTMGRDVLRKAIDEGIAAKLRRAGIRVIPDLCWCSIIEPIFPPQARSILTNSGKYAHYAHGLSGRHARLACLADCVEAIVSGSAPDGMPAWMPAQAGPGSLAT